MGPANDPGAGRPDGTAGSRHGPSRRARRPIVVIYGGMHKTGTSSCQNTLFDNVAALNRGGVDIVRAGLLTESRDAGVRHYRLTRELIHGGPGAHWADAAAEVAQGKFPGYLLMHEEFFGPRIDPQAVRDAFPGARMRIVACLRNPIDYMQSFYRERVHRGGETGDPAAFVRQNRGYLAYRALKARWAAAVGARNVRTVSFERSGPSVVRAVLAALLRDTEVDAGALRIAPRANASIDHGACRLHLVGNRLRFAGLPVPKAYVSMLAASEPAPAERTRLLTRGVIEEIRDLCDVPGDVVARSAVARLPYDAEFSDPEIRSRLARRIARGYEGWAEAWEATGAAGDVPAHAAQGGAGRMAAP